MRAPKVRLYVRVRLADGRDVYADPVWNRNRSLRGSYALVDGAQQHHPDGIYYLRYARGGKRVWESIGREPELALTALRNIEHDLSAIAIGRTTAAVHPSAEVAVLPAQTVSVTEAIDAYLTEVRTFKAPKTVSACTHMLGEFEKTCKGKLLSQVTRTDLLNHMKALKAQGLGDRTVFNHVSRINTLLKANGVEHLLRPADWPKFDEKDVDAYHTQQLAALFDIATGRDRLIFEFLLGTGFREQEVMYCSWGNVDLAGKVLSVWSKPEYGFRVKDKEERSVPVPDSLIESLVALKRSSASTLLFPTKKGKPDGHLLRRLQTLAFRAGLNCGECVTKNGKECSEHPVCSAWGLHKFRRTFATMHAEAGVSAPTIQRWLGHADLATTLRYLAVADIRSERTRNQVNASFAGLANGGAA